MDNTRTRVLDTAKQYVSKDRNAAYDEPEQNFGRIAARWSITLENAFKRGYILDHEVALCMVDVKMARITTSPEQLDHWVDGAGYFACGAECIEKDIAGA